MSSLINASRLVRHAAALAATLFVGVLVGCNGSDSQEDATGNLTEDNVSYEPVGESADALKSVVLPHVHGKLPFLGLKCTMIEGSTVSTDPATGCIVTVTISNCTQSGTDCDCTETISSSNCNIVLSP